MKITKYEHACFTVEENGQVLVVDPGVLSPDFIPSGNIVAVIVTHEHPDHFDPQILATIFETHPSATLVSTDEVVSKVPGLSSKVAAPGESLQVGDFELDFFGGSHAFIYGDVPSIDNIAVLINKKLYYPGDSFTIPAVAINTLAVPLGAPWMKTSEAIDFLTAIKPRLAFPTHDAVLSSAGQQFGDAWLQRFAEPLGIEYSRLHGKTIEI